jgi:hypothetical protein
MRIILLALALIVVPAVRSYGGSISDIPGDRQVILLSIPDSKWNPSAAQTKECLLGLQAYLERCSDEKNVDPILADGSEDRRKWIASQIRQILGSKPGYRVQFWGTTEENKPVVYCNFFPARVDEPDEFPDWRKEPVQVMDGGSAFWFATYDVKTKSVIIFHSNGEAWNGKPLSRARIFFAARSL